MGLPHYFEYTMYCSTKGPVWLVPWTYNGILGNTLEFNINTIEYTMLQGFFFWSLLLKSVSRKLDPITVWLILCSLVQHITEELSLSLALPVEIFQACESPGEPQLQDALKYEKYRDVIRRGALQKNYPGELKDYGYNATHAKHAPCSLSHEQTVTWIHPISVQTNHKALGNVHSRKCFKSTKSPLNLIQLQIIHLFVK